MSRSGNTQNRRSRSSEEKAASTNPSISIVGAGSLGSALALALHGSGFKLKEIICRDSAAAISRAKRLALKVGARGTMMRLAALDSELIWICVPDREIRNAAKAVSARLRALDKLAPDKTRRVGFALHSSGALDSSELDGLREHRIEVASAHPLMTFVESVKPSLKGVPFAIEGDLAAQQMARRIVAKLGGVSVPLPSAKKTAYHAWAMMTSPLLVAYLVTLEEAASAAWLKKKDARRLSSPIIHETLANYLRRGAAQSFSGPIIRGDVETVSRHLVALKRNPRTLAVYKALAQVAIDKLPAKNRQKLRSVLEADQ